MLKRPHVFCGAADRASDGKPAREWEDVQVGNIWFEWRASVYNWYVVARPATTSVQCDANLEPSFNLSLECFNSLSNIRTKSEASKTFKFTNLKRVSWDSRIFLITTKLSNFIVEEERATQIRTLMMKTFLTILMAHAANVSFYVGKLFYYLEDSSLEFINTKHHKRPKPLSMTNWKVGWNFTSHTAEEGLRVRSEKGNQLTFLYRSK